MAPMWLTRRANVVFTTLTNFFAENGSGPGLD